MTQQKLNCFNCKYFYITWDRNFPKGCKLFGFKSKSLPSILVKQSTGNACTNFTPKNIK